MSDWEIHGETHTLAKISAESRKRNSLIAQNLITMLKEDKAKGSNTSIALTIISKIKKSNQNIYLNHPTFPGVTTSLCEESFNDALLAIYNRIDDFDPTKSSLNTWLGNMIYWTFQKTYRSFIRESKGAVLPSIDDEESESWLSKYESSDEDISKRGWQGDTIIEAFHKLSSDEQVLIRYAGYDLTPTQMVNEGYITGVSVNAVGVQFFRARKKFRAYLEEAGWEK